MGGKSETKSKVEVLISEKKSCTVGKMSQTSVSRKGKSSCFLTFLILISLPPLAFSELF